MESAIQLPAELTLSAASAALESLRSSIVAALAATQPQPAGALRNGAINESAGASASASVNEAIHRPDRQGEWRCIDIDASALSTLDSSALAVLLQCRRLAQAQGSDIRLVNPPDKLVRLARLYGVQALLCEATIPA